LRLENLYLEHFRNIEKLETTFAPAINILFGENAQGKTNILEGIYFLAYSKSFRTSLLKNVPMHNHEVTTARGEVYSKDILTHLVSVSTNEGKQLYIDKKLVDIKRYLGSLHIILYIPFASLIYGLPRERRKYLDRAMVSMDKNFIFLLANYNRVIKMRNALFKRRYSEKEMEAWNEQFIKYAIEIWKLRVAYIKNLNNEVAALKSVFFRSGDEIEIGLSSTPKLSPDDSKWSDEVRNFLAVNKEKEEKTGFTIAGPHRDDMDIVMNSYNARYFCSSGQLKATVILLTLAQIDLFYEKYDEYPLLLCDDIDTELDSSKLLSFLSFLKKDIQVFLTTTQPGICSTMDNVALHEVKNGTIVQNK